MGSNVFGTPVTDQFVKEEPEYYPYKNITQKDRARVALLKKNEEGKDVNARKFVETLKERVELEGKERNVAMCLIYNATGATVTLVEHFTWSGSLGESPLPPRIENGQWGAFVTVKDKVEGEDYKCRASVVYSGYNSCGWERHWVLSWSTNRKSTNQVYTEIGEPGEYKEGKWDDVEQRLTLNEIFHSTNTDDGFMFGMIGNHTSAVVEGILTLPNAWFS